MQIEVWFLSRICCMEFCVKGTFLSLTDNCIRLRSEHGLTLSYEVSDPELYL